jgi:hypothetical protein
MKTKVRFKRLYYNKDLFTCLLPWTWLKVHSETSKVVMSLRCAFNVSIIARPLLQLVQLNLTSSQNMP